MLRRKKSPTLDERLDQMSLEVLQAVKVSEEEVEATASAPDLYNRLRLRIASEQRERAGARTQANGWRRRLSRGLNLISALSGMRLSSRWTFAAATAILLLVAVAALYWLARPSPEPGRIAQPPSPPPVSSPAREAEVIKREPEVKQAVTHDPKLDQSHRAIRRRRTESRAAEIATDFIPLTYLADVHAPESGHIVRVRVPRSALVSLGLPMNVEWAGELVKADVVIGDDGLARAIRFVQ